jgi:group I intron endonuclease
MNSGIYKIKNIKNNKVYVGSAINFKNRWFEHKKVLRKNKHHSKHLQNSWNIYKENNFVFEIIEECEKEFLLFNEQKWMDFYKSYDKNFGYNICRTAGSRLGIKHTRKTKLKLSKAHMGKVMSEETKLKLSKINKGKIISLDHRQKTSKSLKGKKHTQEHTNNFIISRTGIKHSKETKIKIGLACKGRVVSKETRIKIGLSKIGNTNVRGMKWSEERRIKNSGKNASFYGKHHSEEAKNKLRESRTIKIPKKIKEDILKKYKNGMNVNKLSKIFNISYNTLNRRITAWSKES